MSWHLGGPTSAATWGELLVSANETLRVPRMDWIVIVVLRQTGETFETARQGCMTADLSQVECARHSEVPRGLFQPRFLVLALNLRWLPCGSGPSLET